MSKPDKLKTLVIQSDPKMMETIINHVANGGSILDLCRTWGVGYSEIMKTIRSNPDYDKQYQLALKDREEWAKERILKEVQALGTFNIKDIFNHDGTIKKPSEMPDTFTAAIKEVTADGDIKFIDKLKALDLYHKQMGLFVDKKEVSGTISLAQLVLAADKLEESDV